MTAATHLKSLQALEMAIRAGSLKDAAGRLGITPAAIGQRIRSLEDFLGSDLLVRGRSGLMPTKDLELALDDLKTAFAALDRVTEALDFQRTTEIHVVADRDWYQLWLMPRLAAFRADNPNILFCINGAGDVPLRLGAPDCRIVYGETRGGEVLYRDRLLPVTGPDNIGRIADWDKDMPLEGMPFIHLVAQRDDPLHPGWPAWVEKFGNRREGAGRGVHYRSALPALEAVRENVGFLICGLSLVQHELKQRRILLPYPAHQSLEAPMPYTLEISTHAKIRPQLQRFCDWLREQSRKTAAEIAAKVGQDQARTNSSALR
ncbi:MAG: LysR family transcriptional regulator [Rhodobacter sp.]|nr:LysR family transcriptional regulator [Rhodobacter sp.]